MRKDQKVSLIISAVAFGIWVIMILVIYFSNIVFAANIDDTNNTVESELTVDTLEFTPIETTLEFEVDAPVITETTVAETTSDYVETYEEPAVTTSNTDVFISPNDIYLTDDEVYRLAALVQAEADDLYECKTAIASLFLNRMYFYQESFWETLNREGQFVTDWNTLAYAEPQEGTIQAVYDVLNNGTTIPAYVMFYKIEGYHDWGDQVGWNIIGTTYFSYSQWQREELEYRLGD